MTIRFRDIHKTPPNTQIRRISGHMRRPRRRSATRASLAGLLIAGAFLLGCQGEHRSDSDLVSSPATEQRETAVASSPEETAEPVNAPLPESKAPSSTERTTPEPPENEFLPQPAEKAEADEDASPEASPSPVESEVDERSPEPEETADEPPTLDEVLERHGDELRAVRGVVGVAAGDCNGAPCIRVTVARRTQKLLSQLPQSLEGYPVSIVEHQGGH